MLMPINLFVQECCLVARNARYAAVDLYLTYVRWALYNGVPVQDQYTFLDMLEAYGLKYRERKNRSWFKGISVLPNYRIP